MPDPAPEFNEERREILKQLAKYHDVDIFDSATWGALFLALRGG